MTPCTALSDRMPDVALAGSRWTAEEARHLAACPDCRAEWAIVSTASRIAVPPDVVGTADRIAGGALDRLRSDRASAGRRRWLAVGAAAAATLALAVWSQRAGPGALQPSPSAVPPPVATVLPPSGSPRELDMPELDSLPVEALDSILRVVDEPLAQAQRDEGPMDDDGDLELERLLAGLEG